MAASRCYSNAVVIRPHGAMVSRSEQTENDKLYWSHKLTTRHIWRFVITRRTSGKWGGQHNPTLLLTACSKVLLEKLTGSHLVKKFPAFYGTRKFITAFTSAHHLYLSWTRSIQSMSPHPTSWTSILILSSHLQLGLPSGPFPQMSPPKPYIYIYIYIYHLPIRATCPTHLIPLYFITRTISGEQYRSLSSSLCSFLHSCYLVPLRSKYSPQHPILKHPQPTFLPQCQRPSFTPISNKRQNYNSACLNIYIFG